MRTRLCDLLGIEHPIIQAGMSIFTAGQSAGLIKDIVPAAEVVKRLVEEARTALAHTRQRVS